MNVKKIIYYNYLYVKSGVVCPRCAKTREETLVMSAFQPLDLADAKELSNVCFSPIIIIIDQTRMQSNRAIAIDTAI